jgi:DNA polymerase III subunit chi
MTQGPESGVAMAPHGIDFYLLESPGDGIEKVTCRLVAKAWNARKRAWIVARNDVQCAALDDLLWTYSQSSFIPHARVEDDPAAAVVIAAAPPSRDTAIDVIFTLRAEPLEEAFHHLRIADIIGSDETERRQARQRYRFYRERGIEPRMIRL